MNNAAFADAPSVAQPAHTNAAVRGEGTLPAFTNLAGKVICGFPEAMTGAYVRIAGKAIKLAVFPRTEQRRIHLLLGTCVLPTPLEEAREFYRNALERLAVLEKGNLISRDDANARRQKILSAWRKALAADTTLLPEERAFWSSP